MTTAQNYPSPCKQILSKKSEVLLQKSWDASEAAKFKVR